MIGEWGTKISQAEFIIIFFKKKIDEGNEIPPDETKFIFYGKTRKFKHKIVLCPLGLLPTLEYVLCICTNQTSLGNKLPSLSRKGHDDPRPATHCLCRSGLCKPSVMHHLMFNFPNCALTTNSRTNIPQSFLKDCLPGYHPQVGSSKISHLFLRLTIDYFFINALQSEL